VAVTAVCPFCRSLLVRQGEDVASIGTMAALPDDISPFQLGTTGRYLKNNFSLIGRCKLSWQDGAWNEWGMLMDDGTLGWLAEAQGFLAVSFALPELPLPAGKIRQLRLNDTIVVSEEIYTVADIKESTLVSYEGEFLSPMPPLGTKARVVDCTSETGGFVSFSHAAPDDAACYVGTYATFDGLHFAQLRALDGWQTPLPRSTILGLGAQRD
jgi:hypothetical protein